jgi:hypothetical protein
MNELLPQSFDVLWLATHAQERAFGIGALLQNFAVRKDCTAQLLRRPR